jgi:hypothetical protein
VHDDGSIFKAAHTVANVQVGMRGPNFDVRTLVLIKIRRIERDTCRSWWGQLNVVHVDGGIFKAAPTVSNAQVVRRGPNIDVRTLGLVKRRRIERDTCLSWWCAYIGEGSPCARRPQPTKAATTAATVQGFSRDYKVSVTMLFEVNRRIFEGGTHPYCRGGHMGTSRHCARRGWCIEGSTDPGDLLVIW